MTELEQQRRALKQVSPKFYAYLTYVEISKLCDALGDSIVHDHGMADFFRHKSDEMKSKAADLAGAA